MPRVNIPGVGWVNFPDTMSEAEVSAAVRKLMAERSGGPSPEPFGASGGRASGPGPGPAPGAAPAQSGAAGTGNPLSMLISPVPPIQRVGRAISRAIDPARANLTEAETGVGRQVSPRDLLTSIAETGRESVARFGPGPVAGGAFIGEMTGILPLLRQAPGTARDLVQDPSGTSRRLAGNVVDFLSDLSPLDVAMTVMGVRGVRGRGRPAPTPEAAPPAPPGPRVVPASAAAGPRNIEEAINQALGDLKKAPPATSTQLPPSELPPRRAIEGRERSTPGQGEGPVGPLRTTPDKGGDVGFAEESGRRAARVRAQREAEINREAEAALREAERELSQGTATGKPGQTAASRALARDIAASVTRTPGTAPLAPLPPLKPKTGGKRTSTAAVSPDERKLQQEALARQRAQKQGVPEEKLPLPLPGQKSTISRVPQSKDILTPEQAAALIKAKSDRSVPMTERSKVVAEVAVPSNPAPRVAPTRQDGIAASVARLKAATASVDEAAARMRADRLAREDPNTIAAGSRLAARRADADPRLASVVLNVERAFPAMKTVTEEFKEVLGLTDETAIASSPAAQEFIKAVEEFANSNKTPDLAEAAAKGVKEKIQMASRSGTGFVRPPSADQVKVNTDFGITFKEGVGTIKRAPQIAQDAALLAQFLKQYRPELKPKAAVPTSADEAIQAARMGTGVAAEAPRPKSIRQTATPVRQTMAPKAPPPRPDTRPAWQRAEEAIAARKAAAAQAAASPEPSVAPAAPSPAPVAAAAPEPLPTKAAAPAGPPRSTAAAPSGPTLAERFASFRSTVEKYGMPPQGVEPDLWTSVNATVETAKHLRNKYGVTDPRLVDTARRFWGVEEAARRLGMDKGLVAQLSGQPHGPRPLTQIIAENDARYRHMIEDPRGFANVEALAAMGGAAAGGLMGATIEGEDAADFMANTLAGMLIGSGVGHYSMKGIRSAIKSGSKANAGAATQIIEDLDTANMLAGPAAIKASLGSMGGYATGLWQRVVEGRTADAKRGMKFMLKEGPALYWNTLTGPTKNLGTPSKYVATVGNRAGLPARMASNIKMQVLRPFVAADRTATTGLRKMGFSTDEAERLLLMGEPTSWQGQAFLSLNNSNFALRMLSKFPRVRIGSLERGAEMMPFTKDNISRSLPGAKTHGFGGFKPQEQLSSAGARARRQVGGAALLVGTAYGYYNDPSLPMMSLVSAAAGPAALPFAMGAAAGKGVKSGADPMLEALLEIGATIPQIGEQDIAQGYNRLVPLRSGRRFLQDVGVIEP